MKSILLAAMLLLGACSASQNATATAALTTFNQNVVADGQLFCAGVTATGPLVVALATASGVPVIATGATKLAVDAACAAIGGIPVSPPPNPAQAPVVAAPVGVAAKPTI